MAAGALGPPLFIRDFAMVHIDRGVSSVSANRSSHRSSA
jgi:hypothetical protein